MLTQKLYKNGNSIAVTIPKEYLEELQLKEGSEVVVEKQGKGVMVTSKTTKLAGNVTPEFMKMVEEFMDEHDDVLKELSKR